MARVARCITKDDGWYVASALNHFFAHAKEMEGTLLVLVAVDEDGRERELRVKPILAQDLLYSADGTQTIKCLDKDLLRVDIILPPNEVRKAEAANVVVELTSSHESEPRDVACTPGLAPAQHSWPGTSPSTPPSRCASRAELGPAVFASNQPSAMGPTVQREPS